MARRRRSQATQQQRREPRVFGFFICILWLALSIGIWYETNLQPVVKVSAIAGLGAVLALLYYAVANAMNQ